MRGLRARDQHHVLSRPTPGELAELAKQVLAGRQTNGTRFLGPKVTQSSKATANTNYGTMCTPPSAKRPLQDMRMPPSKI